MISCAYALLFLNAKGSYYLSAQERTNVPPRVPDLERLIILGNEPKNSFYGAYEVPRKEYFPQVNQDIDVVSTIVPAYHSDIKLVAYCSPTLSSNTIIRTLVHNLIPIVRKDNTKSNPPTLSELRCWAIILKEWQFILDDSSAAQKVLTQNENCLSRDIISLAHRRLLTVTGIYHKFAPGSKLEAPKVKITKAVALDELVSDRQILGIWKTENTQMVLVLYFGHLHIFRRDRGFEVWRPETNIEENENNGAMLLNFIRDKMNLLEKLDDKRRLYSQLNIPLKSCLSFLSCVPFEIEDKFNQIMAEINGLEIKIPDRRNSHILSNSF